MSALPSVAYDCLPGHIGDALRNARASYARVILALIRCAGRGYETTTTNRKIAELCGVSVRTVGYALAWAIGCGFLSVESDADEKSGRRIRFLWRRASKSLAEPAVPARQALLPLATECNPPCNPLPTPLQPVASPLAPGCNPPPYRSYKILKDVKDVKDGTDGALTQTAPETPPAVPIPEPTTAPDPEPETMPSPDADSRARMAAARSLLSDARSRHARVKLNPARTGIHAEKLPRELVDAVRELKPELVAILRSEAGALPIPPAANGAAPDRPPPKRVTPNGDVWLGPILEAIQDLADLSRPDRELQCEPIARELARRWNEPDNPLTVRHFASVVRAACDGVLGLEELAALVHDCDRTGDDPGRLFAQVSVQTIKARRQRAKGTG